MDCRKTQADDAGQHPNEECRRVHRGHGESVEKAGFYVRGEVGSGGDRREERALHQREREQEADVGVGREAGNVRRRTEARRLEAEYQEREQERWPDHLRLPQQPYYGPHGKLRNLRKKRGAQASSAP